MEHWAFLRRAERQAVFSNTPVASSGDYILGEQQALSALTSEIRKLPILYTVSEVAVQDPVTGAEYFMVGFSALDGDDPLI